MLHKKKIYSLFEIKLLVPFLIVVLGFLLFIILANLIDRSTIRDIDVYFLKMFRQSNDLSKPTGPEWMLETMRDITALGSGTVIAISIIFFAGYLILVKRYHTLSYILFAILGGTAIGLGLKEFVGRVRPDIVPHLTAANSMSFPSGHSMMSVVIYLSLAVLLARIQQNNKVKFYIITSALVICFLIGVSRIYLGVHYPTDVLAGWSLGLAWAILVRIFVRWYNIWYNENTIVTEDKINH